MNGFLLVFLGGGLGSCLRYAFSLYVLGAGRATFLANVGASLLIGWVSGMAMRGAMSDDWRLLIATGFCGGFSTFSTFSHDNLVFLQQGNYLSFALNVLLNVFACLIAVFVGYKMIL